MSASKNENVTISTEDINLLILGAVLTATQQKTIQLFNVLNLVRRFWGNLTNESRLSILKELEFFCKSHEDTHDVREIVQELKRTCIFFQK